MESELRVINKDINIWHCSCLLDRSGSNARDLSSCVRNSLLRYTWTAGGSDDRRSTSEQGVIRKHHDC